MHARPCVHNALRDHFHIKLAGSIFYQSHQTTPALLLPSLPSLFAPLPKQGAEAAPSLCVPFVGVQVSLSSVTRTDNPPIPSGLGRQNPNNLPRHTAPKAMCRALRVGLNASKGNRKRTQWPLRVNSAPNVINIHRTQGRAYRGLTCLGIICFLLKMPLSGAQGRASGAIAAGEPLRGAVLSVV